MTKDIQVLTPTGVTYMHKTKHGFAIIGRHTNAMTKSAKKADERTPSEIFGWSVKDGICGCVASMDVSKKP